MQQETLTKPITCIEINDELNAFINRKLQRCRVIDKKLEGEIIRLELEPIARWFRRFKGWKRFDSSATVEVYRDRTPKVYSRSQKIQTVLLNHLNPYRMYGRDELQEMVNFYGVEANKATISQALLILVKAKQLYQFAGTRKNPSKFRLPTPNIEGFPIIEFEGKESRRLGWLVERRLMRSSNIFQPVIHWLDGSESFASEERIEPVTGVERKQVEIAYQRYSEQSEQASRIIPDRLIYDLYKALAENRRGDRAYALLAISQHLGLLPPHLKRMVGEDVGNKVLTYLDLYYPGWRTGIQRGAA
jgi:hypothetical protein